MKHDLRVGLAANVSPQKVRDVEQEPLPEHVERRHRAGLREEPLAVAERVRVLGAQRADRRVAHVAEGHVSPPDRRRSARHR